MKDFSKKKAYITGGSSGIGLAIAEELLKAGASVLLISRSMEKLENAASKLKNNTSAGASIEICPLDITDNKNTVDVLSKFIADSGAPDLLINCAGIARPDYFENISYELFRETLSVNLEGMWNVLSAVVPAMKKKGGHILNVSSVAGFVGTFGYTAYSASKFGIIGLSETLRGELKRYGVSVSVLCPPDTDTPGFKEENKTKPPETIAISGNVKLMKPEEIAKAVISGIRKNKFMIIPGTMGKITFMLKSLLPGLVFSIMDNDAKKTYRLEK